MPIALDKLNIRYILYIVSIYTERSDKMPISISYDGQKPMYEQIKDAIKSAILKGEYKNNDILPSVRQLARDLNISMITTKRAYTDLELEGFIYTVSGKGTFVKANDITVMIDKRKNELLDNFADDVRVMKEENIERKELDKVIDRVYGGYDNE